MADNTKIQWTHRPGTTGESWNPIRARNILTGGIGHFCIHKTDGCRSCYTERLQPRFRNPIRYAAQDRGKVEIYLDEKVLAQPLHWRKPRTIFVCSMTDLFGEWVETEWLDRIYAIMALCPQHTFIVLTKRGKEAQEYLSDGDVRRRINIEAARLDPHPENNWDRMEVWPLRNCWHGGSCHDQESADEIVPHILSTPAAVRFVSLEPQVAAVELRIRWVGIDQIIQGGESGPGARPFDLAWARQMRDDCRAAGVSWFFKQGGSSNRCPHDSKGGCFECVPADLRVREFPPDKRD